MLPDLIPRNDRSAVIVIVHGVGAIGLTVPAEVKQVVKAGDGVYVSPSEPPREALHAADLKVLDDQPVYFRQLLEYLRQQKQSGKGKRSDHEDESGGGSNGGGNGASGAD